VSQGRKGFCTAYCYPRVRADCSASTNPPAQRFQHTVRKVFTVSTSIQHIRVFVIGASRPHHVMRRPKTYARSRSTYANGPKTTRWIESWYLRNNRDAGP